MTEQGRDRDQQHMLLVVESAQRAGCSESEIVEAVKDAVNEDAELQRAA